MQSKDYEGMICNWGMVLALELHGGDGVQVNEGKQMQLDSQIY